nr:uncharacterized protein LOC125634890 [Caretta caretta]
MTLGRMQRQQIQELCTSYAPMFSATPGLTERAYHSIDTGNAHPIRVQPYRVSPQAKTAIEREIQDMLQMGVIRPSESAWASPVVLVPKPDGEIRFCVDYRKLNAVTRPDNYPMPRTDELLEKLGQAQFISTLDLTKGYWQVPLDESAKERSAFITQKGCMRCKSYGCAFDFEELDLCLVGAGNVSFGSSSTSESRLSVIRRRRKRTREDMFTEITNTSRTADTELRAWRISLSKKLDMDMESRKASNERERAVQDEMLWIMKDQADMLRRLQEQKQEGEAAKTGHSIPNRSCSSASRVVRSGKDTRRLFIASTEYQKDTGGAEGGAAGRPHAGSSSGAAVSPPALPGRLSSACTTAAPPEDRAGHGPATEGAAGVLRLSPLPLLAGEGAEPPALLLPFHGAASPPARSVLQQPGHRQRPGLGVEQPPQEPPLFLSFPHCGSRETQEGKEQKMGPPCALRRQLLQRGCTAPSPAVVQMEETLRRRAAGGTATPEQLQTWGRTVAPSSAPFPPVVPSSHLPRRKRTGPSTLRHSKNAARQKSKDVGA